MFTEGSPGCNPPDIRVTKPRRHSQTTTSAPILTFETTQIYLPEDFTTGDLELINNNKDAIRAAFRNTNTGELLVDDVGIHDDLSLHYVNYSPTYTWNDEKKNFEHSKSPYQRAKRAAITFPASLKLRRDAHGVLTISEATTADKVRSSPQQKLKRQRRDTLAKRSLTKSDYEMERIYIQSTDLVSSLQQSPSATATRGVYADNQIRATNRTNDDNDASGTGDGAQVADAGAADSNPPQPNASAPVAAQKPGQAEAGSGADTEAGVRGSNKETSSDIGLRRVKRKSGKTTGALSRPKSDSGSSSSKSTSRKTQCKYTELTSAFSYPVELPMGGPLVDFVCVFPKFIHSPFAIPSTSTFRSLGIYEFHIKRTFAAVWQAGPIHDELGRELTSLEVIWRCGSLYFISKVDFTL